MNTAAQRREQNLYPDIGKVYQGYWELRIMIVLLIFLQVVVPVLIVMDEVEIYLHLPAHSAEDQNYSPGWAMSLAGGAFLFLAYKNLVDSFFKYREVYFQVGGYNCIKHCKHFWIYLGALVNLAVMLAVQAALFFQFMNDKSMFDFVFDFTAMLVLADLDGLILSEVKKREFRAIIEKLEIQDIDLMKRNPAHQKVIYKTLNIAAYVTHSFCYFNSMVLPVVFVVIFNYHWYSCHDQECLDDHLADSALHMGARRLFGLGFGSLGF